MTYVAIALYLLGMVDALITLDDISITGRRDALVCLIPILVWPIVSLSVLVFGLMELLTDD